MPWSDQFLKSRGLRRVSRKKLSDEIFIPLKKDKEFKILIVDDFGMKILSATFKTEEVMGFNIALIEELDKTRQPVPFLSAIYLCTPSKQNIALLQSDFISRPSKYLSVHLFFLSRVPREYFDGLAKYSKFNFVQTFKEIDFLFIPYESQVFSLNDERFFSVFFDANKELDMRYCAFVAKKLATLCVTLKTWPRIRYRRQNVKNLILAESLETELLLLQDSFPSFGLKSDAKPRTEVLIIDRGFDCVSPLVYECTFQAMAHDLLDIENDIYEYIEEDDLLDTNKCSISLTEADELWHKLRHEHIADVAKIIDGMAETHSLLKRYPNYARLKNLPEIGDVVKKHLAYRKNQPHTMCRRLANECMKLYWSGINAIDEVMQDLAVGAITKKSSSKNTQEVVLNFLSSSNYTLLEKLRLLLLYIFQLKGITKNEFDELIVSSNLPYSEARIITNVLHLDVDIFRPGVCQSVYPIPRQDTATTSSLRTPKWSPAIKNIIWSCIDGSLCEDNYPYLDRNGCSMRSERTGYWARDKKADYMSRLIVFIAGGVTYSEMRCVYEIMSVHTGWEVCIGSDCFLTPKMFLHKLKQLHCFISEKM